MAPLAIFLCSVVGLCALIALVWALARAVEFCRPHCRSRCRLRWDAWPTAADEIEMTRAASFALATGTRSGDA